MDVKLLTGMDMKKYAKLCDAETLAEVLDEAGGFRTGCFGLGILNKDGYGRALLLAASDPGQPCRIVSFLYNHERYPQDAEALLRMAGTYAGLYGMERIECEYVAGDGQEAFQRCGWSGPVTEQVNYRVPVQQMETLCGKTEPFEGTVVPFDRISLEAWLQFMRESDGDSHRDRYRNVYAPDTKISFGAMLDDRLVGYMLCRENGKQLAVDCFYAADEYPGLLQVFLTGLIVKNRQKNGTLQEVQICAHDRKEEEVLQSLLGQTPHLCEVWMKSEWSAVTTGENE